MQRIWVGSIAIAMLLVGFAGGGSSAPHPDYIVDDFRADSGDRWQLIKGDVDLKQAIGPHGDYLSWLVLEDDDDTGLLGLDVNASRVRADPASANTTMTSYSLHVIAQRVADYVAPGDTDPNPGPIALTFGERDGLGYYVALFDDGYFGLGAPNATSDGYDILHEQDDWGSVPAWIDSVDDRHRYTVHVVGTTLGVAIDGWAMDSFTLPSVPAGTFGLAAADDTQVYAEQLVYGPYDTLPPTITVHDPMDATININDIAVPIPASGMVFAVGTLTVRADISDDVLGTQEARLRLDGAMVKGSGRYDPGENTTWTVDLTGLATGYHTLTVEATDWAGNVATNTTRLFVIGAAMPDSGTRASAQEVAGIATGLLPV